VWGLPDAPPPGEPGEIAPALAEPYPVHVIADLLGIPERDRDRFVLWSDASIPGASDLSWEECAALMQEMQAYLMDACRSRRGRSAAEGTTDLITTLANVEVDGERLTDDELLMFMNQLLVAGNETTRNMISGGLWALASEPEQWRRLVADPSLVPACVEEWLRWTTPVVAFLRTATIDTELRGTPIAAGDPVLLLYASANRDEDVFPDNHTFDVGRTPNEHVTFGGGGEHYCLGASLARAEIKATMRQVVERLPDIELAGPVNRLHSDFVNGIKTMPVRFTPTAPLED